MADLGVAPIVVLKFGFVQSESDSAAETNCNDRRIGSIRTEINHFTYVCLGFDSGSAFRCHTKVITLFFKPHTPPLIKGVGG